MNRNNYSPLNEGGKWGSRDPGTGWSQKEKLDKPKEHSKVVEEGVKYSLPLIASAIPVGFGVFGKIGAKAVGRMAKAFWNTPNQLIRGWTRGRNITTSTPGTGVRGHGRIQDVTSVGSQTGRTNIIGKGELWGRIRAYNKPGTPKK